MYVPSNLIEVKVIEDAGTIVLNRPQHTNALTRDMIGQITEALDDLCYEKRVRAIVLTGAGDAFSTGIDLAESQAAAELNKPEQFWGEEAADLRDLVVQIFELAKPVIAAVNGPALSFGATLALAADIVVASTDAHFGLPDARWGLVAGLAAPLLNYRIGSGKAAKLLLTGCTVDADEALDLGLFHELIEPNKVWARAMQLASECAQCAPQAVQLTKRLLAETTGEHLVTQLSAGAVMRATARTTAAAEEGVAAILEGRPPTWE